MQNSAPYVQADFLAWNHRFSSVMLLLLLCSRLCTFDATFFRCLQQYFDTLGRNLAYFMHILFCRRSKKLFRNYWTRVKFFFHDLFCFICFLDAYLYSLILFNADSRHTISSFFSFFGGAYSPIFVDEIGD